MAKANKKKASSNIEKRNSENREVPKRTNFEKNSLATKNNKTSTVNNTKKTSLDNKSSFIKSQMANPKESFEIKKTSASSNTSNKKKTPQEIREEMLRKLGEK